MAVAIGIVLALLVAITNNLWPGILFHIVFNISGSISVQESSSEMLMLVAILAISLSYALYLSNVLNLKRSDDISVKTF